MSRTALNKNVKSGCLSKNYTMKIYWSGGEWINFMPWSLYPQGIRPQYPLDTNLDTLQHGCEC